MKNPFQLVGPEVLFPAEFNTEISRFSNDHDASFGPVLRRFSSPASETVDSNFGRVKILLETVVKGSVQPFYKAFVGIFSHDPGMERYPEPVLVIEAASNLDKNKKAEDRADNPDGSHSIPP